MLLYVNIESQKNIFLKKNYLCLFFCFFLKLFAGTNKSYAFFHKKNKFLGEYFLSPRALEQSIN